MKTAKKKGKVGEYNEEKEFEERIFPIEPQIAKEFLSQLNSKESGCRCGGACKKTGHKHEGKECSHHNHKK